ncbi:amino acid adenylation domain-containing protein [Streptomyces sp. NPDC093085]|uniref:amino acid adenylation domain-containing protein n=1 Tax=Streptomyces sp. NPDC093085 TaxID=3155068 RepID=UPI0034304722
MLEYRPRTLVDLFERQVRERPDAPAVRTRERTWSYAAFDRATAALAHRLRRAGAGPGTVVGVHAPRGVAALTALVAVLRCGAACLPLDPDDPPRRNLEVLADAGCTQVLVTAPTPWYPGALLIEEPGTAPGQPPAESRLPSPSPPSSPTSPSSPFSSPSSSSPSSPSPLDLAYAITTSGSTGRPKIVGVPHEGILNLIVASIEDLDLIRPDDVALWTTAPTVDSTMHDVLMPLCAGACVAIADGGELPASRIPAAVRTLGVTVLEIPAAVLGPYGATLLPRLARAGVRLVITGGSQLDGAGLADSAPLVVANGYGPTEASVAPTWHRCTAATPRWVPIGRPIRGVRTYVLDDEAHPVPAGDEGQLFLAGAGLARGYLGLPGRTAAVFLPDPFARTPGARMYATGDRVRLRPDGELVYLGRIDDQVKIRGFRVEIGEIEHALRACPGAVDAAALLREDAPGGAAVAAFLVGERSPDEELTGLLRDRLPRHMVPRFFVWLDELPLNRAGKVDRKALATLPVMDRVRRG